SRYCDPAAVAARARWEANYATSAAAIRDAATEGIASADDGQAGAVPGRMDQADTATLGDPGNASYRIQSQPLTSADDVAPPENDDPTDATTADNETSASAAHTGNSDRMSADI